MLTAAQPGGFLFWMSGCARTSSPASPQALLGGIGFLFLARSCPGLCCTRPSCGDSIRRVRWDRPPGRAGSTSTTLWASPPLLALMVGATGVVNALAEQVLAVWRADQLAEMTAPWRGQPPAARSAGAAGGFGGARGGACRQARSSSLGRRRPSPAAIASGLPAGDTPPTAGSRARTRRCQTGRLTALRPMPWYVGALFLSPPLHFGD